MTNFTESDCHRNITGFSTTDMALYVTMGSIESFLIIISNILTIAIIIKFPRLRNTSNILIANLAVSDLLVGVLLIPGNMIGVVIPKINSIKYGCLFKTFNLVFIFGSALLNLFLISIDRLVAIFAPIKYMTTQSLPLTTLTCAVTWFLWACPCVLAFWVFDTWDCESECSVRNVIQSPAFQFIVFVFGSAFSVGCGSFLVIVIKLKVFNRRTQILQSMKDTRKKTGMMILVFGLFVFFLVPLIISAIYASFQMPIKNQLVSDWIILIAGANSFINGAIYGWKRPEFRKAYRAILLCDRRRQVVPIIDS